VVRGTNARPQTLYYKNGENVDFWVTETIGETPWTGWRTQVRSGQEQSFCRGRLLQFVPEQGLRRPQHNLQRNNQQQLEEGQDSPDMQEYLRQKIKQLKAERKTLIEAQRLVFFFYKAPWCEQEALEPHA
jgi:hypothetical protein